MNLLDKKILDILKYYYYFQLNHYVISSSFKNGG